MAYWKRQYTDRPTGKPLFRPEPKSADQSRPQDPSAPADASEDPGMDPASPGEETPSGEPPGL